MAIKPTDSAEWATDSASLKLEPTAKMLTHGWTTSDDTLSGTPPKPTFQHQNGWNYNVSLWIDWIDASFPALNGDYAFEDLWEWDTGGVPNNGTIDPFTTDVTINKGPATLIWNRDETGAAAATWTAHSPDCLFGAKFLEFYDMIGRGLALKIIDGSSVEWIIYNVLGEGISDDQHTEPLAEIVGHMGGVDAATRTLQFEVNSLATNIGIVKDGVPVSDFTGFTTIDMTNFLTENPNGFRVGRYHGLGTIGESSWNYSIRNLRTKGYPRRRWIRPINVGDAAAMAADTTPDVQFRLGLENGKSYRFDYDCIVTSVNAPTIVWVRASELSTEILARSYGSTSDNSVKINGGFTYPRTIIPADIPALRFEGLTDPINGNGRSGDISGIYNFGNHRGCMLWVSERN